jgi:hypothetical protein
MPRRKVLKADETPALLRFREKRKWQINLRRYVLNESPCPDYAPYFGLDIKNMRQWFEYQFKNGLGWDNFGDRWQFDHIVPVTYFDFSDDAELKMCWNFTNLRVEESQLNKDRGNRVDILAAKNYFNELYQKTQYQPCLRLLKKIDEIEISELVSTEAQHKFIQEHLEYLKTIESYSFFEFEMLNSGRSMENVKKEIDFAKSLERGNNS